MINRVGLVKTKKEISKNSKVPDKKFQNLGRINLGGANLEETNFHEANLQWTYPKGALNLSIEQLSEAKTLYKAKSGKGFLYTTKGKMLCYF